MSTKNTIKQREVTQKAPGFHVYDDVMESMTNENNSPVYLELNGVQAEIMAQLAGGVSVTVRMPRETARALGLLRRSQTR